MNSNSNSHPATKTKPSDEEMSCKDILVLVKNMRAELLAFREECAESVKRSENKVNELNSVLDAGNSKIQTLETEISSLKGQSKAIHDRFKEEIKGNAEELTSVKGKVETMEKKVSNTSIKRKQHQRHGESNSSERKSSKNQVAEPQSIDANPSKHGKGADPVENNRKSDTQKEETLKTTTVKKSLVQKDRE